MVKVISFLKIVLVTGVAFGVFFGIGVGMTSIFTQADKTAMTEVEDEDILKEQDGTRTNILLLGVDARPGETKSRSDTMMLVSVDPKLDKAVVISIPRDTRVEMKGTGLDRIAAANVVGGPEYAVKTVEDLMKVNIDYYVELDFNGFKDVIDTLGGVNIDVPTRMYKPSEDIDLKAGPQKLDGRGALAFVRYRGYINGDIDRAAMQQTFMKALADEILQAKTITKLPKLIKQASQYVTTDMGITDMLRLASWAPGFTAESIVTQTLPGSFYDVRDANGTLLNSYWVADKRSLEGLIDKLMEGETIAVVQGVVQEKIPSTSVPDNQDNSESPDNSDEIKLGERDQKTAADERSKLPSPGHDGEFNIEVNSEASGPEGYI